MKELLYMIYKSIFLIFLLSISLPPVTTLASENKTNDKSEVFLTEGLLSGYTIVLDPGHGGKDPGALGHHEVLEKDLILSTTLTIAKQLDQAGATVILTREDDSFVSLKDRVQISNQSQADAFISIHFNSYEEDYVGGFNTYYDRNGKRLAYTIQENLSNELHLRDRGVIQHGFTVLRENERPAVLIELGFITNKKELATLQTEDYQSRVAEAIRKALVAYFWN
jgi:N-acetylmuramoyl-L-alanine amidase